MMEASAKQSRTRRLRGWFFSRLSDKSRSGHHRTFRGVPDFFRLAVESLNEYALITMDKDRVISSWSGPAAVMFGASCYLMKPSDLDAYAGIVGSIRELVEPGAGP
ncbi:MAG: hypothetical protein NUW21_16220 [Elusimicrobia bacterium]|nr:hypothetical protein [Elusimicrobiota bacterium]